MNVYAFGMPRAFDPLAVAALTSRLGLDLVRVVNNNDAITRTPPPRLEMAEGTWDYAHLGKHLHLGASLGSFRVRPWPSWARMQAWKGRFLDFGRPGFDGLTDHGALRYEIATRRLADDPEAVAKLWRDGIDAEVMARCAWLCRLSYLGSDEAVLAARERSFIAELVDRGTGAECLVASDPEGRVYEAWRGTQITSLTDIQDDLAVDQIPWTDSGDGWGLSHRGFTESSMPIAGAVAQTVSAFGGDASTVIRTGHSLGAGRCAVAAGRALLKLRRENS